MKYFVKKKVVVLHIFFYDNVRRHSGALDGTPRVGPLLSFRPHNNFLHCQRVAVMREKIVKRRIIFHLLKRFLCFSPAHPRPTQGA